jgi:hypothetical protein
MSGLQGELVAALCLVDQAEGTAEDRTDFNAKFAVALKAVRAALAKVPS